MSSLPVSHILYLHGFRSSPRSFKARVVQGRLEALGRGRELVCPQLPASPRAAMALVLTLVERHADSLAVIGSSLGGFYATWLAERFGCRAALLNPAVDPLKNLEQHVGLTTAFHSDEPFEFKREYIDELAALKVERITRTTVRKNLPPSFTAWPGRHATDRTSNGPGRSCVPAHLRRSAR